MIHRKDTKIPGIKLFLTYLHKGLFAVNLRMLKNFIFSRLRRTQLERIFVCPSHACNARCVHCYENFSGQPAASLTTDDVHNIVDQFHALGGYQVYFCSGEFLLRPDALALIRYVSSRHMVSSITTNGLLLSGPLLDDLKAAGLTELIVSIDSADPRRHDERRGVPGCFEKAAAGLKLARERGIITYIWTYVSRSNADELDGIIALGQRLQVELVYVFFPLLSGKFFDRFDENLSFEEREEYRHRYNEREGVLLEFPTEGTPCTGGGLDHVCVMPSGDVTFCPPVPYSYGNVHTTPLKECLRAAREDYRRFPQCTRGQCPVNFPEYRDKCRARFLHQPSPPETDSREGETLSRREGASDFKWHK